MANAATQLTPGDSVVTYNNVTFGNDTRTLDFTGTPVYGASGREVIYTIYRIRVQGHVIATGTEDGGGRTDTGQLIEDIREQLSQPGGSLEYHNAGFGDFQVNTPGSEKNRKDVIWGPKPRTWTFERLGDPCVMAKVTWSVEVALPEHCQNALFEKAIMEFAYRLSISINKGWTTRTYSGHIRIPQTYKFAGDTALSDHVDKYRDKIIPQVPLGFRRPTHNFNFDYDKCKMDFTIVDEELPQPLPFGVVEVSASQETHNVFPMNLKKWNTSINATYELAKGVHPVEAWKLFHLLCTDRIDETTKLGTGVFPLSLRFSDPDMTGKRRASFSFTYTHTTELDDIIAASGIWRPIPNAEHSAWRASMANGPHHHRGYAKMAYDEKSDSIVTLCNRDDVKKPGTVVVELRPAGLGGPALKVAAPDEDASWIEYFNGIDIIKHDNTVPVLPLPVKPLDNLKDTNVEGKNNITKTGGIFGRVGDAAIAAGGVFNLFPGVYQAKKAAGNLAGVVYGPDYAPKPNTVKIQRRADPVHYAVMYGKAVRAGFEIPRPDLNVVGGRIATPYGRGDDYFTMQISGNMGITVYSAQWRITYILDGVPGPVQSPPNPLRKQISVSREAPRSNV